MSSGFLSNVRSSLSRFSGVLLLATLLGTTASVEAAPAAGTVIRNQAVATYNLQDPNDPQAEPKTVSVLTNTVEAVLEAVEGITLVPDRQTQSSAGSTVSFSHTLSNTGTVNTNVSLQFNNLPSDNFDLNSLKLIQDLNNNGIADPGEPVLSLTDQIPLAVGQSVSLILTGVVPGNVSVGDLSRLQILATATAGSKAQVVDTVTINAYVAPRLDKSASVSTSKAGGVVSYTLNLSTGSNLQPRTVTVDGSDVQMIVVRDAMPANTTFVSVQQDAGAKVLYQQYGDAANQYKTVAPVDLSTVSAIAFGFQTLPAQSKVTMQFQLQVNQYTGNDITNTGIIDAMVNGKPDTVPSNPVVVKVPPQSGVLEYRDPSFKTVVPATDSGTPLNLFATAPVCNVDPAIAETYAVTLLSAKTGDLESSFKVTETGPNTGIYSYAGVPTKLAPPATSNNGVMEVAYNDTVKATLMCGTSTLVANIKINPENGLALQKTASQDTVEVGDTVTYTVQLRNGTPSKLDDLRVDDAIPAGFVYVAGSARLGGAVLAEPTRKAGRTLSFAIGSLDVGSTVTLTYVLKVGAGAIGGDGINTAQAHNTIISSNVARAKVNIDRGVFGNGAIIFGKIFVDCNRDDLQGAEELGIPGVRMYLDDGTYAITDVEGKYSFYGIVPRTHTLKLDRITLPPGAEMATVSNRNGGDPQSRFVDLKNGEMHRADFAEGSCTPEIVAEVKKRRAGGDVSAARIENAPNAANALPAEDDAFLQPIGINGPATIDPRSRPAAGIVDAYGKIKPDAPLVSVTQSRNETSALGVAPVSRTASMNLEAMLPKLKNNDFGFMDLKDGDTLPGTDLSIRIVGRDGSNFRLFVNDEEIPASRVGQRARMPSRQLQVWEYIGIKLKPGPNQVRAENYDGFGNKHESTSISLKAPGKPGQLVMVLPPDGAVADGQTPAHIMVRLLDADNVPVTARTMVTLESSLGRWDVEDLDEKQPGVQTFMQGGEALFDLIPPTSPGSSDLRISSGDLESTARLPLNPHLRPLIASGIIEGAIGFNKLNSKAIQPATAADGFEQDIKNMNSDGSNAGVRGSMFLKGKVKGSYLLTLAYDSDKDSKERLFRDIDPENYYPIYGDSSVKGFDAQSTSKLYVRIDKGRSYLLYGDFNTNATPNPNRQLSNYSRSLTGVSQHYENDRVSFNLFASHETSQQQSTEFRAQGISGPYQLPGKGFVINSEKIELVTRSKNTPSLVIDAKTKQMTRFVDYTIDALQGSIIFTRPIAGTDNDGDIVYIRITWEVDNGGDAVWVYGADGTYRLNKFLAVGASVVRDNAPGASTTLAGANAELNISKDSKIVVETARSESETKGVGSAWRAEWTMSGANSDGRIYAGKTDASFFNPNAGQSAGSFAAGIKGVWKLSDKFRFGSEGVYTEDSSTGGGRREGIFNSIEYAVTQNLKTALGVRYTHQDATAVAATTTDTTATEDSNVTSLNAKVSWNPEMLPKAGVYAEYEQGTSDSSQRMVGVGGTYQVGDRSRIYARHELISSTSGPFGLSELSQDQNSTAIGLEYDYLKNSSIHSEYRIRDGIDGPQAQAALGLTNGWSFKPGLKLSTQFERQQPLSNTGGTSSQQSTSASVGLSYTADPLLRAGTRLEWRQSNTETSVLNTIAIARKLSLDWSVMGKNTLSVTSQGGSTIGPNGLSLSGPTIRDRFRIGAAWRQTDLNRWAWLGLYETRYDRDPGLQQSRVAHILSSNVNYQPNRQWTLSGRYAFKYVNEVGGNMDNDFVAHLISGRAMFDISEKWDAGLIGSTVFDANTMQYGLGAEVGYLVTANLWLSGGYNFFGYVDKDFDSSDSTRAGPYMRLRFKFDEEMFRWLE